MKLFRKLIVLVLVSSLLSSGYTQSTGIPVTDPATALGTLSTLLQGAGSIDDALGSLLNLLDNFSWDGFVEFACQAAQTANQQAGSGESQTAEDIVCTIAGFYEEVQKIAEDGQATVDTLSASLFSEKAIANLGNGFFSSPQIEGWRERIQTALSSDNPQERLQAGMEIFREIGETEYNNQRAAATSGSTTDGIVSMVPILDFSNALALQNINRYNMQQFNAASNTKGTSDIANLQSGSKYSETASEGVKDVIAPKILGEAEAAVSTRATVQEVVSAITAYMAQDADQFAYLSDQLTLQAQQQVYTTSTMEIIATSVVEERVGEQRRRIATMNVAIANTTNRYQDSADQFVGVLRSFTIMGGERPDLIAIDYGY
jgi:hypothetical protein